MGGRRKKAKISIKETATTSAGEKDREAEESAEIDGVEKEEELPNRRELFSKAKRRGLLTNLGARHYPRFFIKKPGVVPGTEIGHRDPEICRRKTRS